MFSYSLKKAIYISAAPLLWHLASNHHIVISLISGCKHRDESNLQKPTLLVMPVIGWCFPCKFRHFQRCWLLANRTYLASKDICCSGRATWALSSVKVFGLFEQMQCMLWEHGAEGLGQSEINSKKLFDPLRISAETLKVNKILIGCHL